MKSFSFLGRLSFRKCQTLPRSKNEVCVKNVMKLFLIFLETTSTRSVQFVNQNIEKNECSLIWIV